MPSAPAPTTADELKAIAQSNQEVLISNQRQYAALEKLVMELQGAVKNGSEEAKKTIDDLQQRFTLLVGPDGRKPLQPIGLTQRQKDQFSYLRAMRGIYMKDWTGAGFEQDMFAQGAKCRAQASGTDTAGGYWLPPELSTDFIEQARAALVLEQLGARVETDVSGAPYEISGQAGGCTAVMIGENSPITESQLSAKLLKAFPHMAGAFVIAPLGLINRATNPNAEEKIRADMSAAVARLMELQILQGNGVGANLLGMQNRITEVTTAGSFTEDPFWQNLVRLRGRVMDQNIQNVVDQRSAGYLSSDKGSRAYILQGVDQFSTPGDTGKAPVYGNPILTLSELATKIGTKFLTTNAFTELAANKPPVWFGLWSELVIPVWGQVNLAVSDVAGSAFQNVQLYFRAVAEFDYLLRYPEAFAWKRVDAANAA